MSLPGKRVTSAERSLSAEEYEDFRSFLEKGSGIVLGENKHYLVVSRLFGLLDEFGVESMSELLGRVKGGRTPRLRERVIEAMTTNETYWFRDNFPFDYLQGSILKELGAAAKGPIRIWCAACSTGQEPYSISMAIQEYKSSNPGALRSDVEIVGTDISPAVLRDAQAARYESLSMARGLSAERKQRFFVAHDRYWELKPELRARVSFRELNLLQSYALLGRFDIVFCRNVLIYFSPESKRDILDRIAKVLNPGGYLLLGASETMSGYSDAYEMIRAPRGVVYRRR
jgi:chemotaxis protein methyltransferase CheR